MLEHGELALMSEALELAHQAYKIGEVPIGAIVVSAYGEILSKCHNLKEKTFNPCGHAEMLALEKAGANLKNWRLEGCSLYTTLEPCPMCLDAMRHSRIHRLVFGAYDQKGGALGLGINLHQHPKLNHRFKVIGGIKHFECSKILSDFFKERRSSHGHF